MSGSDADYASRAGVKLAHALKAFDISPRDWTCADFGCSTGGFVDCLLRFGAARVYAVDRGYGVLAHALRNDPRIPSISFETQRASMTSNAPHPEFQSRSVRAPNSTN